MRRVVAFAVVLMGLSTASAQPCGDRLASIEPASAMPGDRIVLHGSFADERGARRPVANLGGSFDLEVIDWTPSRIVARLPAMLPSGMFRVGVYCDGRPGPTRFLHATDFLELEVVAVPAKPVASHRPSPGSPTRASAAQFEAWLAARPVLRESLIWEDIDGPQRYEHWPAIRRAALYRSFRRAVDGLSGVAQDASMAEPPENLAAGEAAGDALRQRLSADDAERLYLDAVGHSLALEYAARLPWSIADYPVAQQAMLLDARQFFRWRENGYEVELGVAGMALSSPSATQWAFLHSRIGADRRGTIVTVLDWLAAHAMHFEGRASSATMQQQWQYPGYPPVARVLAGTPHLGRPTWPVRPRTAGCFGSAGFLRALLRSANIPVAMISTCAHFQVAFPSEGLFLSHGDDPYSGDFTAQGCSADRLLIDGAQFAVWFRQGSESMRCENIGRAAREVPPCR